MALNDFFYIQCIGVWTFARFVRPLSHHNLCMGNLVWLKICKTLPKKKPRRTSPHRLLEIGSSVLDEVGSGNKWSLKNVFLLSVIVESKVQHWSCWQNCFCQCAHSRWFKIYINVKVWDAVLLMRKLRKCIQIYTAIHTSVWQNYINCSSPDARLSST